MKKIAFLAVVATAAIASPAMAQSATGTVQVTGSVAAKCTITSPAPAAITLNELALADGTVNNTFSNTTGGLTRNFTVKCTSGSPTVAVSSTQLNNTTDSTTGGGYTGQVQYTSTVVADKSTTGTVTTSYTTLAALPAASSVSVGVPLKNAADNVRVTVSNGTTTNTGDLLKSGSYTSTITVVVSPT